MLDSGRQLLSWVSRVAGSTSNIGRTLAAILRKPNILSCVKTRVTKAITHSAIPCFAFIQAPSRHVPRRSPKPEQRHSAA